MTQTAGQDEKRLILIGAPSRHYLSDLRELVEYRDLLAFLIARGIKVRYRQTLLGGGWAILQPVLTMAMMTIVFGKLIGLPSDGVPYPLFCLAGLVLWAYVTQAISSAASSIVSNAQLIEKVYFPRLLIPLAAALGGLLDALVSFVILLLMMLYYSVIPSPLALLCVPLALLAALLATSVGSALAALTVRFRDFGYLVPFGIQLAFYATPVAYPASLVPEQWRLLYAVNPAVGLIEAFRWALLRTPTDPWPLFGVSMLSLAIITLFGLMIFKRMEHSFADVI